MSRSYQNKHKTVLWHYTVSKKGPILWLCLKIPCLWCAWLSFMTVKSCSSNHCSHKFLVQGVSRHRLKVLAYVAICSTNFTAVVNFIQMKPSNLFSISISVKERPKAAGQISQIRIWATSQSHFTWPEARDEPLNWWWSLEWSEIWSREY